MTNQQVNSENTAPTVFEQLVKALAVIAVLTMVLGGFALTLLFMWSTMKVWLGFIACGLIIGGLVWSVRRLSK